VLQAALFVLLAIVVQALLPHLSLAPQVLIALHGQQALPSVRLEHILLLMARAHVHHALQEHTPLLAKRLAHRTARATIQLLGLAHKRSVLRAIAARVLLALQQYALQERFHLLVL